ncbi:Hsp20/alpha crystallin family protein [Inquilinus sp. OTU3971]|uniref:Hsp20/alpha crystallin family protein n=1 Tax=Inquilinus sp. OTU3971 TaxID=3043855 RepID=UPI00313B50E0
MMTQATKVPAKTEPATPAPASGWDPFQSLRQEIDQVFDSFVRRGLRIFPFGRTMFGSEPIWSRGMIQGIAPAVDIAEKDKEYKLTAELPGLDERHIEVKLSNGVLTIKGEKSEEKEEREKDYQLCERRYGAFQRSFTLPDNIDAAKIAASFKNGVLTISLPKTAEALKSEKTIDVKAA